MNKPIQISIRLTDVLAENFEEYREAARKRAAVDIEIPRSALAVKLIRLGLVAARARKAQSGS